MIDLLNICSVYIIGNQNICSGKDSPVRGCSIRNNVVRGQVAETKVERILNLSLASRISEVIDRIRDDFADQGRKIRQEAR
jgi:hypothetical protein